MSLPTILDHDATEALIFMSYLPDFNEELFIQLGEPLDTFTYFPKLPPELRLKIWRWSFPRGREVSIAHDLIYHHEPVVMNVWKKAAERKRNNTMAQLPPTLFINRESRQETLRHYVLIIPGDLLDVEDQFNLRLPSREYGGSPPFCFNIHLDTPHATLPSLLSSLSLYWFKYLYKIHPEIMHSIRVLEIKEWRPSRVQKPPSPLCSFQVRKYDFFRQFLLFEKLQTVVLQQPLREIEFKGIQGKKLLSQVLEIMFNKKQKHFGGRPPQVRFQIE